MAIDLRQATRIAQGLIPRGHELKDRVLHGEGRFVFFDANVDNGEETDSMPLSIGDFPVVIVWETDGSTMSGSAAPTCIPRSYAELNLSGRVERTEEDVASELAAEREAEDRAWAEYQSSREHGAH